MSLKSPTIGCPTLSAEAAASNGRNSCAGGGGRPNCSAEKPAAIGTVTLVENRPVASLEGIPRAGMLCATTGAATASEGAAPSMGTVTLTRNAPGAPGAMPPIGTVSDVEYRPAAKLDACAEMLMYCT
jgi:hypothetical protein